MIIEKSNYHSDGDIVDLTGPQGNAFCLLGLARRYAKQVGIDPHEVFVEMTNGDYENLIKVFDKYFGSFVTLLR